MGNIKLTARGLILLVLLLAFTGLALALQDKEVKLYDFCLKNKFTLKVYPDLGYFELTHESRSLKVFLSVPYIVYDGNIYYFSTRVTQSEKGELILPADYAAKVLFLLNDQKSSTGSGPVKSSMKVTGSSSSLATILVKQNQASPTAYSSIRIVQSSSTKSEEKTKKDDRSEKKDYNNRNEQEPFDPINAVIIDPGHGGKDPGGIGVNGIKEKEIVFNVGRLLYQNLRKDERFKVIFTRKGDLYVTLKERTEITAAMLKKKFNPIFISIHGNISLNRNVNGIEIYTLSDKASDEEALSVEMVENAGFSKKDVESTKELASIISDLLKDGIRKQSEELAKELGATLVRDSGASLKGLKKANFYVLKYNSVPSVLAEIGFMSNPEEGKKLMDRVYQKKIASGLSEGILNFIENYNKSRGFTR